MNDDIKYAGFWRRWGANIIDSAILTVASLVFQIPLLILPKDSFVIILILSLLSFIIFFSYYIYFVGSPKMATPGKIIAGIVVTDTKLQRVSYLRSTARLFSTLLSYLTFCIGFLICPFNKKKRCLHDFIAGTLVVDTGKGKPYFVIVVVIIVVGSIASSFLFPAATYMGSTSTFEMDDSGWNDSGSMSFDYGNKKFEKYFNDPDDVKNLGKKAKIISNNDVPVFEKIFDLNISSANAVSGGVAYKCQLKLSSKNPLVEYAPAPKIKYSVIYGAQGNNLLNKKAISEISEDNKIFFDDKNSVMQAKQYLNLKDNKPCKDAYQIHGSANISMLRKLYVIELSTKDDLEVPYSLGKSKNLILIKKQEDGKTQYELQHNLNRKVNLKPYNKNGEKLHISSSMAMGEDTEFTTINITPDGEAEKIVLEIPVKIERKNVPFIINTKPSKLLAPQEEIAKFNKYLNLAIKGNAEAQYLVGYFYSQGEVVERDMRKTVYWLQESYNNGFEKAKTALEQLSEQ